MGHSRRRDDCGLTLIELVVTVAILGISFVALVAGIGAAVAGSTQQRRRAATDAVVRTAADHIRDFGPTPAQAYADCALDYDAAATAAVPAGYAATAKVVGYWDGEAATNHFTIAQPSSCLDTPAKDNGLQLIELQVTSPDGKVTEAVELVKRR